MRVRRTLDRLAHGRATQIGRPIQASLRPGILGHRVSQQWLVPRDNYFTISCEHFLCCSIVVDYDSVSPKV